jgi:hypothetical protein
MYPRLPSAAIVRSPGVGARSAPRDSCCGPLSARGSLRRCPLPRCAFPISVRLLVRVLFAKRLPTSCAQPETMRSHAASDPIPPHPSVFLLEESSRHCVQGTGAYPPEPGADRSSSRNSCGRQAVRSNAEIPPPAAPPLLEKCPPHTRSDPRAPLGHAAVRSVLAGTCSKEMVVLRRHLLRQAAVYCFRPRAHTGLALGGRSGRLSAYPTKYWSSRILR